MDEIVEKIVITLCMPPTTTSAGTHHAQGRVRRSVPIEPCSRLSAVGTRSGWASATGQVVPNDLSALHDKRHPQHFSDVPQGIAGDGNQISDLALFDRAETILLVNDGGIDRGSHLQGERRGGAPLDENREHFGLHTVRALAGLVENAPRPFVTGVAPLP